MFCVKCGAENTDTDKFCRKCGAELREPRIKSISKNQSNFPVKVRHSTSGLTSNISSALCYLLLWISGIIFLMIEQENRTVRFHAWQSIVIFGLLSLLIFILNLFSNLSGFIYIFLLGLYWLIIALTIFLWAFLMLKAYSAKDIRLPLIGTIASKLSDR